ncbi:MAG: GFA family protein [Chloroflexota bacterium]
MTRELKNVSGACLCGEITFNVNGQVSAFHMCHCTRCRRSTGTAHASNIFTAPDNITWLSGEANIRRFELPEAERFAKQFCLKCGSLLPYINRAGTALVIPAGSLIGDPGVVPQDNIFWDERAAWYDAGTASVKYAEYPT